MDDDPNPANNYAGPSQTQHSFLQFLQIRWRELLQLPKRPTKTNAHFSANSNFNFKCST
jgi:hypothetical protein